MSKERANSLYPASMLTRRSKVGIVGAGFVGTALAYACLKASVTSSGSQLYSRIVS